MISQAQMEERDLGVGGSDAPAICGLDKYRQPLGVWFEKAKGIHPDRQGENERALWGNLLEAPIATEWSRRNGASVVLSPPTLWHPDLDWMMAHIDGLVEPHTPSPEGLEVKSREIWAAGDYGPSGSDTYRESDLIQCQHYLAVTGFEIWNLVVFIGKGDLRHYRIPRDQSLIDSLISIETDFWDKVIDKTPPPVDFAHGTTADLLSKIYPGTNGVTVQLSERADDITALIADLKQKEKEAKGEITALKNELREMIGENAAGTLKSGGRWRRKLVTRSAYSVAATEYEDFRFVK